MLINRTQFINEYLNKKYENPFYEITKNYELNINKWIKLFNFFNPRNRINSYDEYINFLLLDMNTYLNKIKKINDDKWNNKMDLSKDCLIDCLNNVLSIPNKSQNTNDFIFTLIKRIKTLFKNKEITETKELFIEFITWIITNNGNIINEHTNIENIICECNLMKGELKINNDELKNLNTTSIYFYISNINSILNSCNKLYIDFNENTIQDVQKLDNIIENNGYTIDCNDKTYRSFYQFIKKSNKLNTGTPRYLFEEKLNIDNLFKEFILYYAINGNKNLKSYFEIKTNSVLEKYYQDNNLQYNSLVSHIENYL